MDYQITKTLVEKKLLKEEMEVTATYTSPDFSGFGKVKTTGSFFIHGIQHTADNIVFVLRSTADGKFKKIFCEYVETIEGMPIDRFCACYNLNLSGENTSTKKKRGRRSKAVLQQMALEAQEKNNGR